MDRANINDRASMARRYPFADYPAPAASGGGGDGRAAANDAFIDKIIAAARAMPPEPAPGAGEIRLKGLRQ